MTELFAPNVSIECLSAEVITRKIASRTPTEIPGVGRCIKYNCNRDSSAEIKKELEPKLARHRPASSLNFGDLVKGRDIMFFYQGIRPLKPTVIGGHSGRHKAQALNTRSFTYARAYAFIRAYSSSYRE